MRSLAAAPLVRLLTVLSFILFGIVTVLFLMTESGLDVPFVEDTDYRVVFESADVDNLEEAGHVRIAGVQVGEVQSREVVDGIARVEFSMPSEYAPLHEGATIRVGAKSLVEETYLDVTDGSGPEIPSGTVLPREAVQRSTQLHDVLFTLDADARTAFSEFLRSSGAATTDTKADVDRLFTGLGLLGREGSTALEAVAAQSEDLRALVRETTAVLGALDTSEGQIATMVSNADRLTEASAAQRAAIEDTVRALPPLLQAARPATEGLTEMAGALGPVAANLNTAAPALSDGLEQLPGLGEDLRGAMPPLNGTLDRAPATLDRVPTLAGDLQGLFPPAVSVMRDLNPMLEYIRPYGPEFATWFAHFGGIAKYRDTTGVHYWRFHAVGNPAAAGLPVTEYANPIPEPGTGGTPGPFTGEYPRIEREGP